MNKFFTVMAVVFLMFIAYAIGHTNGLELGLERGIDLGKLEAARDQLQAVKERQQIVEIVKEVMGK